MAAQNVADILGCPLDMATGLLEAAGGDMGLAIELGMGGGMGGGGDDAAMMGGGGFAADAPAPASSFHPPFQHWSAVWPETKELPESWKDQRLDAFDEATGGIVQPLNGPCGVLAVVQAELWLQQQQDSSSCSCGKTPTEAQLTTSVSNILQRVMKQHGKTQVSLGDGSTVSLEVAAKRIRTAPALVDAAATTAGPDHLRSMTSLVEGPNWMCSSDLLCLLLRGKLGNGNFGAFDPNTKQKTAFYDDATKDAAIGVLSHMEIEQGVPVADDLKLDKKVYVVHTGDHFLTMRVQAGDDGTTTLELFDGLKPNGPVTTVYKVTGDGAKAAKAPAVHEETFRKKRVGQADDIVQAGEKGNSPNYQDWKFEVIPAIDDPDVQGPTDDDPNEPPYDFSVLTPPEGPWRCATCYANRFKTMCFGQNDGGATCSTCQMPQKVAMWSLWLPYDELTPRMKRRAREMYAPKVELVISTLYPKAKVVEVTSSTMDES
ncbi:MAG: hypothetical protein SGILL_005470 [Bacillariaceae sp.]